jgi:hypothetical protein
MSRSDILLLEKNKKMRGKTSSKTKGLLVLAIKIYMEKAWSLSTKKFKLLSVSTTFSGGEETKGSFAFVNC